MEHLAANLWPELDAPSARQSEREPPRRYLRWIGALTLSTPPVRPSRRSDVEAQGRAERREAKETRERCAFYRESIGSESTGKAAPACTVP